MSFSDWIIPLLLVMLCLLTLKRGKDPYEALISGAEEGFGIILRILPALIILLTAAKMLRASGFFELLGVLLEPMLTKLGISAELLPLLLLQPLSGSGSLALAGELIQKHGAESEIGRIAAVLLGSSETTFYTIAVYFGAAGIKRSRYAVHSALIGDFFGAFVGILAVKIFF